MPYASSYPGTVDSFSYTTPGADRAGVVTESDSINRALSAAMAIETELGVNPSGSYVDVATRLNALLAVITTDGTIAGTGLPSDPLGINNEVWAVNVPTDSYVVGDWVFAYDASLNVMKRVLGSSVTGGSSTYMTTSTKTANYTAVSGDRILADTTSGGFTVTLPTAVSFGSGIIEIHKLVAANTLTIATTSSQTINGSTTLTVNRRYTCITLISDGANWRIV